MKNNFEIRGDVTAIFLCKKSYGVIEAIIDTQDLPLVKSHTGTWHAQKNKSGLFYAYKDVRFDFKKTTTYLHRFLLNAPCDMQVDHINGNTMDNRRENLRIVTQEQNRQNLTHPNKTNKSSMHLGICWRKDRKKWTAEFMFKEQRYYLGQFDHEEEAVEAYKLKRAELQPFSKERREIEHAYGQNQ